MEKHKVGDKVYIEYYDGSIASRIIRKIKPDSAMDYFGNKFYYNAYYFDEHRMCEDYNCLSEDDPRVQNYIKEQELKLESQLNSLYEFVKDKLDIHELSDRELDIIKTVLKYNNLKELI